MHAHAARDVNAARGELGVTEPHARGLGIGWYQEPGGKIWWVELLGQ